MDFAVLDSSGCSILLISVAERLKKVSREDSLVLDSVFLCYSRQVSGSLSMSTLDLLSVLFSTVLVALVKQLSLIVHCHLLHELC